MTRAAIDLRYVAAILPWSCVPCCYSGFVRYSPSRKEWFGPCPAARRRSQLKDRPATKVTSRRTARFSCAVLGCHSGPSRVLTLESFRLLQHAVGAGHNRSAGIADVLAPVRPANLSEKDRSR